MELCNLREGRGQGICRPAASLGISKFSLWPPAAKDAPRGSPHAPPMPHPLHSKGENTGTSVCFSAP